MCGNLARVYNRSLCVSSAGGDGRRESKSAKLFELLALELPVGAGALRCLALNLSTARHAAARLSCTVGGPKVDFEKEVTHTPRSTHTYV